MGVIGFFVTSWLTRQSSFLFFFLFASKIKWDSNFAQKLASFYWTFFASNFAQKKACRALPVTSFRLRKSETLFNEVVSRSCKVCDPLCVRRELQHEVIETPKLNQPQLQLEILVSSSKKAKMLASTDRKIFVSALIPISSASNWNRTKRNCSFNEEQLRNIKASSRDVLQLSKLNVCGGLQVEVHFKSVGRSEVLYGFQNAKSHFCPALSTRDQRYL